MESGFIGDPREGFAAGAAYREHVENEWNLAGVAMDRRGREFVGETPSQAVVSAIFGKTGA